MGRNDNVSKLPGLIQGMGVTFQEMTQTMWPGEGLKRFAQPPSPAKGAATVQYPHEKEAPPTRARGVIALHEENCTACMLCARSCPDWCIYIEAHKAGSAPSPGGKPRVGQRARPLRHRLLAVHVLRHLRRGVPVRGALLEPRVRVLRASHRRPAPRQDRLGEWMETVPDFEPYEAGAEVKQKKVPR
jgi:NADH-quinone oxidoreductase subunit I